MQLQGKAKKDYQKGLMRKRRPNKGLTGEGSNDEGLTGVEMVPASYVMGLIGMFESLPERPRFLTLSDGQVLDRLNQPEGHTNLNMQACNESSYNFKPHQKTTIM